MADFILWAMVAVNVITIAACVWIYCARGSDCQDDFSDVFDDERDDYIE